MQKPQNCPPVLFLVFNRPDVTKRVFDAIKAAKPKRLYVAADGPRSHKAGEAQKVEEVRRITSQIDWDCELFSLFRDENLGCKLAVSSAINWFFEQEEAGIILEDDCLPDPSFFDFCAEMLEHYKDENRVMKITGSNFIGQHFKQNQYSYFFSHYTHVWGWASWRRAWKHFTLEMTDYEELKDNGMLASSFSSKDEENYFWNEWERTRAGILDSWAYRWGYAQRVNSGLSVVPKYNMISNIGFGDDSTHTGDDQNPLSNFPAQAMKFPLQHPPILLWDKEADAHFYHQFLKLSLSTKFKLGLQKVIPPHIYAKIKSILKP